MERGERAKKGEEIDCAAPPPTVRVEKGRRPDGPRLLLLLLLSLSPLWLFAPSSLSPPRSIASPFLSLFFPLHFFPPSALRLTREKDIRLRLIFWIFCFPPPNVLSSTAPISTVLNRRIPTPSYWGRWLFPPPPRSSAGRFPPSLRRKSIVSQVPSSSSAPVKKKRLFSFLLLLLLLHFRPLDVA